VYAVNKVFRFASSLCTGSGTAKETTCAAEELAEEILKQNH
jgi:hypothetical protein